MQGDKTGQDHETICVTTFYPRHPSGRMTKHDLA